MRENLPARRESETFTFSFASEKYHVTIGFYSDGRPGEIFINRIRDKAAARLGEQLEGVCRDGAILLSLALQHGCELSTIRHAITRNARGEPSTIVGAIVDHVGGGEEAGEASVPAPTDPFIQGGAAELPADVG